MSTISITFTTTHELKGNEKYQFYKRRCFNVKKGIEIKRQYKNGSEGFYIDRDFKPLNQLRLELVKIKENECPF